MTWVTLNLTRRPLDLRSRGSFLVCALWARHNGACSVCMSIPVFLPNSSEMVIWDKTLIKCTVSWVLLSTVSMDWLWLHWISKLVAFLAAACVCYYLKENFIFAENLQFWVDFQVTKFAAIVQCSVCSVFILSNNYPGEKIMTGNLMQLLVF